jgi:5'(3')-deoxyribonucleotidase
MNNITNTVDNITTNKLTAFELKQRVNKMTNTIKEMEIELDTNLKHMENINSVYKDLTHYYKSKRRSPSGSGLRAIKHLR